MTYQEYIMAETAINNKIRSYLEIANNLNIDHAIRVSANESLIAEKRRLEQLTAGYNNAMQQQFYGNPQQLTPHYQQQMVSPFQQQVGVQPQTPQELSSGRYSNSVLATQTTSKQPVHYHQQEVKNEKEEEEQPVQLVAVEGHVIKPFVSNGLEASIEVIPGGYYKWKIINKGDYNMQKIFNLTPNDELITTYLKPTGTNISDDKLAFFKFNAIETGAMNILWDVIGIDNIIVDASTPTHIVGDLIDDSQSFDIICDNIKAVNDKLLISGIDRFLTAMFEDIAKYVFNININTKSILNYYETLLATVQNGPDIELGNKILMAFRQMVSILKYDLTASVLASAEVIELYKGNKCKSLGLMHRVAVLYSSDKTLIDYVEQNKEDNEPAKAISYYSSPDFYNLLLEAFDKSVTAKTNNTILLILDNGEEYNIFRNTENKFIIKLK